MKTVYLCEDSIEGICTGIYYAWPRRHEKERDKICVNKNETMELFSEYACLDTEKDKAQVVLHTIMKHLGEEGYQDIFQAAMSWEGRKADAILGTVIAGTKLRDHKRVMEYLSNEYVHTVFELSRNVGNEAHHYRMFLRFHELENGILFGEISPKNNVLPFMISHFADRFPLENWLIYDHTRKEFLLHQPKRGCLYVSEQELDLAEIKKYSQREEEMKQLWKQFYEDISIKERESYRRQVGNMPLRFRNHMVECE